MAKCNFCGFTIEKGTGLLFVDMDGRALNFCSRKCYKNQYKLRRRAQYLKWTKSFVKHAKPVKKDKSRRSSVQEEVKP